MIKSKLGMTFVEVIVAMAIFAILIVAIFPAFITGLHLNAVSKIQVETSTEAQTIMEEIYGYSLDYTLADTLTDTVTDLTRKYPKTSSTTLYWESKESTDYTIEIIFTEHFPQTGMTTVKVKVTKNGAPPGQVETILVFK